MYPEKFQQDFINKKKYWMAIPKLPPLDIDQIKTVFLKYKNKLKKDELNRNEFIEVYKINVRSKNKKVI
jgi:5'-3' exonuclease